MAKSRIMTGFNGWVASYNLTPESVLEDLGVKVIKENFGKDSEDLINKIFYKNADDLFFKKEWINVAEDIQYAPSISKIALIAVGAIAGLSTVSYVFNKFFGPKEVQDERFNK